MLTVTLSCAFQSSSYSPSPGTSFGPWLSFQAFYGPLASETAFFRKHSTHSHSHSPAQIIIKNSTISNMAEKTGFRCNGYTLLGSQMSASVQITNSVIQGTSLAISLSRSCKANALVNSTGWKGSLIDASTEATIIFQYTSLIDNIEYYDTPMVRVSGTANISVQETTWMGNAGSFVVLDDSNFLVADSKFMGMIYLLHYLLPSNHDHLDQQPRPDLDLSYLLMVTDTARLHLQNTTFQTNSRISLGESPIMQVSFESTATLDTVSLSGYSCDASCFAVGQLARINISNTQMTGKASFTFLR